MGSKLQGILAAACLLLLIACHPKPPRALMIGDSLTAGVVGWPKGPSYPDLLTEQLRQLDPRVEVTVLGWGGTTTEDWLDPLYEPLARPRLPANLVVVMLGSNDAIQGFTVTQHRDNAKHLIRRLLWDGASMVLWATPPKLGYDTCTNRGTDFGRVNRLLAQYREAALELCRSNWRRLRCGPDLQQDFPHDGYGWGCDPHPNAVGTRHMANKVYLAIQPLYYLPWSLHGR